MLLFTTSLVVWLLHSLPLICFIDTSRTFVSQYSHSKWKSGQNNKLDHRWSKLGLNQGLINLPMRSRACSHLKHFFVFLVRITAPTHKPRVPCSVYLIPELTSMFPFAKIWVSFLFVSSSFLAPPSEMFLH